MLNQRENLFKLWSYQGFDFAPVQFSLCPAQEQTFKEQCKTDQGYEDYFNIPWRTVHDRIVRQNFTDWRQRYYSDLDLNQNTKFDWWGVAREPSDSFHMEKMHYPLRNADSLEQVITYPFPEITSDYRAETIAMVKGIQSRGLAASGWLGFTVWESVWFLRSLETTMVEMMTDDPIAHFLFDKVTDFAVKRATELAHCGVDILALAEDVGMQNSEMMSVELYRQYLKPGLTKVIKAAKAVKPDIIIAYHSCGHIHKILPDLLETGIEVLNPLQPEAGMDFESVYDEYHDRVAFWGGLGTQSLMPFGTADDVRKTTLRYLEKAGERGGLLCTPTHLIEPEVPWENLMAYVNACKEFSMAHGHK